MESNIFGELLTSYIILFIPEEYPDPPTPYPLDPNKVGPMGGPGGLNEGGDFMSLTPKCDMFLEIPWEDQTENIGKVGNVVIVGKVG